VCVYDPVTIVSVYSFLHKL